MPNENINRILRFDYWIMLLWLSILPKLVNVEGTF
jgi:hypothetical protein